MELRGFTGLQAADLHLPNAGLCKRTRGLSLKRSSRTNKNRGQEGTRGSKTHVLQLRRAARGRGASQKSQSQKEKDAQRSKRDLGHGVTHHIYSPVIGRLPELSLLPGPLLGSLNLNQGVLGSTTGSARRRRYIEEAEMFNIEVSEDSGTLNSSDQQHFDLSFPSPGFAGRGLFCSSLPRPRAHPEISPDLHEHSKSKHQQDCFRGGGKSGLTCNSDVSSSKHRGR